MNTPRDRQPGEPPASPVVAALTDGLFDYAGLFPPAKLTMADAVGNFLRYREGRHAAMLGRFVVPAGRLPELLEQLDLQTSNDDSPVPLSVLTADWNSEGQQLVAIAEQHADKIQIASIEQRWSNALPQAPGRSAYVEVAVDDSLTDSLEQIKRAGAMSKIRMGGLQAEAFPTPQQAIYFLRCCRESGVAYKATAGLHHPFPASRPVCTEPNAETAQMHGFVNIILAASLLESDVAVSDLALLNLVADDQADGFTIAEDGIQYRDQFISLSMIRSARERFQAIGSCSFEEPLFDLAQAGWLPASMEVGED